MEGFTDEEKRKLLKFVTSCSRPPLLGFKVHKLATAGFKHQLVPKKASRVADGAEWSSAYTLFSENSIDSVSKHPVYYFGTMFLASLTAYFSSITEGLVIICVSWCWFHLGFFPCVRSVDLLLWGLSLCWGLEARSCCSRAGALCRAWTISVTRLCGSGWLHFWTEENTGYECWCRVFGKNDAWAVVYFFLVAHCYLFHVTWPYCVVSGNSCWSHINWLNILSN